MVTTRYPQMDDAGAIVDWREGETTVDIPAFITVGTGRRTFGALAKDAPGCRPAAAGRVVADTEAPIGTEQVGHAALNEGSGETAGEVLQAEGCLEVADGDVVGAEAGVLDPRVAHAAAAAVGSAGTGEVVLVAVIPVLAHGTAHIEEQAPDVSAVTESVAVFIIECRVCLQTAAHLEGEVTLRGLEGQLPAVGGRHHRARGRQYPLVDFLLLLLVQFQLLLQAAQLTLQLGDAVVTLGMSAAAQHKQRSHRQGGRQRAPRPARAGSSGGELGRESAVD